MKVVVLGGYGVFGGLLSELLIRDGHDVCIAGRNLAKARELADEIGGTALGVDFLRDPSAIFGVQPDIVVDAAGPFQNYGQDPYKIPRLCIQNKVDYFDFSDSADFTAGIAALDDLAKASGCRALSGASSVPGLSSAVVRDLANGFDDIISIETAILPGNRAPRGTSVIASIVGQVGQLSDVWIAGRWRPVRCWTQRRIYEIAPGIRRAAYFINVPDIRLFPDFFQARSVEFRAGMELGIMNGALAALGFGRRFVPIRTTPSRVRAMHWIADRLKRFGTDRGGMIVRVLGSKGDVTSERQWRMLASAGDGPFVPAIAVRTLVRRLSEIPVGARPCLAEFSLNELESAMSDLAITTETTEYAKPTLFQAALADRWNDLPSTVQALHSVQDVQAFSGTAQVERGTTLLARLSAWFFGFPQAGDDVPITVTKTRNGRGEIWERNFAGRVFRSYCTPATGKYRYKERFWLFNYEQDLPVSNQTMHLPVRRGWILGIPIPRPFLPKSDSREYEVDGIFHFDVGLSAPLGGDLIVRYRGWLVPDSQV